jgi:membrane-associated phospholipid phosphatase
MKSPFAHIARYCFLAILLLFSVTAITLKAQINKSCNTHLNIDYIKSYWQAGVYTLKQPASYQLDDWLLAGTLTGMAAVIYTQDRLLFDGLHATGQHPFVGQQKMFAEGFGSGLTAFPMLIGMYAYGSATDNLRPRHAALAGMQSFLLSAGLAFALKELTHRPRPHQQPVADPKSWFGPFEGSGFTSFPSGHSMRSFALATVLAGIYHDKPWLGAGFYALAGLTAFSRLNSGEHWPSDVVVGALLGYGIGRAVLHFNRSKSRPCMKIAAGPHGIGFNVAIK